VSEDRPLPVHEAVKLAQLFHAFMAGPQIEMISVAENDLRADFLAKLLGRHGFHSALRADRHENRGLNLVSAIGPLAPRKHDSTRSRSLDAGGVLEGLLNRESEHPD